jgi:acyl-CoA synthetase (AMP-forming)/AMP-acid ligase II
VSYGEIWSGASAVAGFLRASGLKPGDRVGILMENRPEFVSIYYGVQAARGAVVALNAADKARSFLNCLEHAGAGWLFADGAHRELPEVAGVLGDRVRLVTLDGERWESLLGAGHARLEELEDGDPDALAQLIYTSGTTGNPKAVMLSHRNLVSNVRSILDYLELDSSDSICSVLPFHYSYGNSVLHTHLAAGGRVVLQNSLLYPHEVLEQMSRERVTGFSGVPSTFTLLLRRTRLADFDLSSLRYMTQAGGPMSPADVERMRAELPHVRFFVMYGQTEATARLSYLPPDRLQDKLGSCGIPIPGVELEIRGKHGAPLKAGETGEIWARGDNVMLGYWRNADATREVLREGWLRTGDLGCRDEDGFLFIRDRVSDMIKSGAHRISPGEIEEVIAELAGVAEVAVVGVPDRILGQCVHAVIVPARPGSVDERAVKRHCMKNLAQHKVPKSVKFVRGLPRGGSGKIQRHLLAQGER